MRSVLHWLAASEGGPYKGQKQEWREERLQRYRVRAHPCNAGTLNPEQCG